MRVNYSENTGVKNKLPTKFTPHSVIPAKAGIQERIKEDILRKIILLAFYNCRKNSKNLQFIFFTTQIHIF